MIDKIHLNGFKILAWFQYWNLFIKLQLKSFLKINLLITLNIENNWIFNKHLYTKHYRLDNMMYPWNICGLYLLKAEPIK